jgi:hypothetical protein
LIDKRNRRRLCPVMRADVLSTRAESPLRDVTAEG